LPREKCFWECNVYITSILCYAWDRDVGSVLRSTTLPALSLFFCLPAMSFVPPIHRIPLWPFVFSRPTSSLDGRSCMDGRGKRFVSSKRLWGATCRRMNRSRRIVLDLPRSTSASALHVGGPIHHVYFLDLRLGPWLPWSMTRTLTEVATIATNAGWSRVFSATTARRPR